MTDAPATTLAAVPESDSNEIDPRGPRLLTPSKVTAWLDCPHYLTLKHRVEQGTFKATNGGVGEFARLLMDKGLEHERACLADYQRSGKTVHIVPDRPNGEKFEHWVARVGDVMSSAYDVIYQMPFVHGGMRGIADFLVKHTFEDGTFTYEPLDAKLARKEAKPGHVLQLCFYADAIEAAGRPAPPQIYVWLGSGKVESIRLAEVRAYWRRLQLQKFTEHLQFQFSLRQVQRAVLGDVKAGLLAQFQPARPAPQGVRTHGPTGRPSRRRGKGTRQGPRRRRVPAQGNRRQGD